jgi:hypothetical protein
MIDKKTFGIICIKKDEKILMERVNAYLKTLDRTTSKAKHPDMLKPYLPFVYKHYYWNLNKGTGTWFDLFPNEDVNEKYILENNKEYGWIFKCRIDRTHPNYNKELSEGFIENVLNAAGFEYVFIGESASEI